ncbi:MAG: glycoside hydrolase family 130 protein [Hyphomonadaceae bacterium]|nr:glycoside hydrolase family 130 protein [Hyphomonadaceae bacterium]
MTALKPLLHTDGSPSQMFELRHHDAQLVADPSRVVLRPFSITAEPRGTAYGIMTRAERIVKTVLALSDAECRRYLDAVDGDFFGRHWQTHSIFIDRFEQVRNLIGGLDNVNEDHAKLIGAYFSHEYSYAAAAVMNPSIVVHPDQSGVIGGAVKFVLSLRTVGEGHISSISFREGLATPDGNFTLWPETPFAIAATTDNHNGEGGPVAVRRHDSSPLSGVVIFPITRAQKNGLEDLRLVRFTEDDGAAYYVGTYTAFSGRDVGCEMLTTERFSEFDLTPLRGAAAQHKGLALFPRRIDGRYTAIGRLDHESLYFMQSDDRFTWNYGKRIMQPKYLWELVQLGNCGSPIELDEGWLLLTHGVGAMRQYSMGAALLDKRDPSKVIGRSREPFLTPVDETREGYVPNVVYTCGALKVGEMLLLPYGVADSSVRFVSMRISDLLATLK